ncbi:unnamed protein product, partial [Chrysoparadoxa australica]
MPMRSRASLIVPDETSSLVKTLQQAETRGLAYRDLVDKGPSLAPGPGGDASEGHDPVELAYFEL